jgi:photosystem II stability/assembly factor-like uncharacterized protein
MNRFNDTPWIARPRGRLKTALPALVLAVVQFAMGEGTWVRQNPIPTGQDLRSVRFVDAQKGWAVGAWGAILKSVDGGLTWSSLDTGRNEFTGIFLTDFDKGWIAGEGGVWQTNNGGGSWSKGTQPIGGTAVFFVDANVGWAVGSSGRINKTTNGGGSWAGQQGAGSDYPDLNAVYFANGQKGWACGSGKLFRTTNGGSTWSTSTTSSLGRSVQFVNPDTGWLVGGTIRRSNDGGVTWFTQDSATSQNYWAAWFLNRNEGWAVGVSGLIRHTMDGGVTWETQVSNTTQTLYSVHFVDSARGWAVGEKGMVLRTINGGTTWTVHHQGPSNNWNSVSFSGAIRGWLVGEDGAIWRTINGGVGWSAQSSGTAETLYGVHFVDDQIGYAVGTSTILRTISGGASWSKEVREDALKSVHFVNRDTGWAVGNSAVILRTRNGGSTWSQQNSEVSTKSLLSVHFANARKGWAVGTANYPGYRDGMIMRTTDGGDTWSTQYVPNSTSVNLHSEIIRSVYFADSLLGWAVGSVTPNDGSSGISGIILRTTDGGASWAQQTINGNQEFLSVSFAGGIGWITGPWGTVFRTSNGTSWTKQSLGTAERITAAHFRDAGTGWVVGEGGVVYKHGSNLKLTAPNGGESWQTGSIQNIQWTSSSDYGGTVRIEFSGDDGATWRDLPGASASDPTVNDGSFSWTVPDTAVSHARIRISDPLDGDPLDISDSNFSILAPVATLTVTVPNGGESWAVGSPQQIQWTSANFSGNVRIEFSNDGGASWGTLIASTANNGIFGWTVMDTVFSQCRIRVADASDGEPFDISNGNFKTFIPPRITLMTPNGGESWSIGSIQPIVWTSHAHDGGVRLQVSRDGGGTWQDLPGAGTADPTANDSSFTWTVSGPVSAQARIRISDPADGSPADTSAANFSVINLTATSPGLQAKPGFVLTVNQVPSLFLPGILDAERVTVSTLSGRILANLRPAGNRLDWNGRNRQGSLLERGVYFVRVQGRSASKTSPVVF